MFPDGAARRAVSHRRRDAVVLSRGRALHASRPATTRRCASCCRCCSTSSRHHLRGTQLRHPRRSGRWPVHAGSEGYQLTWMDAKVGDWVVTPRRGKAVETQRALVQRALPAGRRGRSSTAAPADSISAATRGRARDVVQRAVLVRARAATVRRRRRRARRRYRPAGPNQVFAISLPHPVLDRDALGAGDEGGARAAADAGRPALARARAIPITRRGTTAICARATPPTIRAPSGPG